MPSCSGNQQLSRTQVRRTQAPRSHVREDHLGRELCSSQHTLVRALRLGADRSAFPIRPQTLPMSAVPYKVFSVFLLNLHYYPHSQMIKGSLGEEKTLVLGFAKSGDLLGKHLISALPDFAYITCGCGHHIMGQMCWEQQRCKTEQRNRDQHPSRARAGENHTCST